MESINEKLVFTNYTDIDYTANGTGDIFVIPILPYQVRVLRATIAVIELIIGVFLNTSLILLIIFRKSLHQRGFATAVLILSVNMGYAVPLLSTSAYTYLAGEWTFGDGFCQFLAFSNQMFPNQRWFLTTVLVIDRALTINRPLRYEKHGAVVVLILSTVALIAGLLNGVVLSTAFQSCIGYIPGISTCYILYVNSKRTCGRYLSCSSTIVILLGGVLPFCLYIWMFYKAKKAQRQVVPRTQGTVASSLPSVPQHKQIFTLFLFFWTLLGCSLPYYFSFLILFLSFIVNLPSGIMAGYYLLVVTQPIYQGLVIADPIAMMWHKDVKRELRKLKHKIKTYIRIRSTSTQLPSST